MTRSWTGVLSFLLLVGLPALLPPAPIAAQEVSLAGRAPRFLIPAPRGGVEPVEVDAGRVAALRRKISLDLVNVRLEDALETIARRSGTRLVYVRSVVPLDTLVRFRSDSITVAAALTELLLGLQVDVLVSGSNQIALIRRAVPRVAPGSVVGRVTDAKTGDGVAGAEVQLEGTKWRVGTREGGHYRLVDVVPGSYTLTVRRVGYAKQSRAVTVGEGEAIGADLALEPMGTRLDEVVVTATGPRRRMDVANQVTVIRADSVVQTQPIKDLTDLLDTRVPGLAVLPTTGAPGDPARLRLRGASSILRSNDPIVIVDGVRIHSEQTQDRSGSLAWGLENGEDSWTSIGAPSPLDRIDPNSVETVEVLNGPSAATLYGAEAANGVIVITTKQGRPGPAKWDFTLTHGRSSMPGRFPDAYFGFGRSRMSDFADCSVTATNRDPACVVDSVVSYQVLNDPALTVLGRGQSSSFSATVSGGRPEIRYAITGSYSDETGLLKLPQYEADRFRAGFGRDPEEWMERPHHLTRWSVASRFDFKPARSADVAVTMGLAGDEQRRSSLETQLSALRGAYVDKTTGQVYLNGLAREAGATLVPDFYRRTTNRALALKSGVNLNWRPFERFSVRADAGISADLRRDESMLPRGLRIGADSLGLSSSGQGTVTMGTLNLGGSYQVPLGWGFTLDAAAGFNYTNRSVADLARSVQDPTGGVSTVARSQQRSEHLTSHGWYVEPKLVHRRFSLSTGLRIDGGSNYGSRASGFTLPKLGGSWLISDEPFFPLKNSRLLSTLRLRAAYGQAGVQPGPADRLRLYARETHQVDGQPVEVSSLRTLGNTLLRPERSTEIEGGFDADLFDSRISVGLTAYRKTKNDALLSVPLPESVNGGGTVLVNVGVVRNSGYELTLGTNLLTTDLVSWSAELNLSHNRNVVVSLADQAQQDLFGGAQRVAPGYPLFGFWDEPIVGYADANGDGMLQRSEVVVADSVTFLGATDPDLTGGLHTTVGLFRGTLTVSAGFDYRGGFAQMNAAPGGVLARAQADPSAPLEHQVLVVARHGGLSGFETTDYGLIQSVSTLRFNSLAVSWQLPNSLVRWVGAERGSLAVQGTNLGLRTSYRGKDPLVNSLATGDQVLDAGALPQPREWRVRLGFSY